MSAGRVAFTQARISPTRLKIAVCTGVGELQRQLVWNQSWSISVSYRLQFYHAELVFIIIIIYIIIALFYFNITME